MDLFIFAILGLILVGGGIFKCLGSTRWLSSDQVTETVKRICKRKKPAPRFLVYQYLLKQGNPGFNYYSSFRATINDREFAWTFNSQDRWIVYGNNWLSQRAPLVRTQRVFGLTFSSYS
jgi:hypothetical protein